MRHEKKKNTKKKKDPTHARVLSLSQVLSVFSHLKWRNGSNRNEIKRNEMRYVLGISIGQQKKAQNKKWYIKIVCRGVGALLWVDDLIFTLGLEPA